MVVATLNQEKALEGAFSVVANLRVDLCFQLYYAYDMITVVSPDLVFWGDVSS